MVLSASKKKTKLTSSHYHESPFTPLFFICVLQLTITGLCSAQTKTIQTLQSPPANITIDGDTKDWGDSLRYYNAEKMISYALANNKDTLYMAIRVNDRAE